MQKNENMFVLAGVLFVITAVVALLLSAVNRVTAVRIEENTQREQAAARSAVLQSADAFAEVTAESDATGLVQQIFEGQKDGQLAGYCVSVAPAGFGGTIDMMVGIQPDGRIEGVKIVSLSETPGLGSKAQDDSFCGQFSGKGAAGALKVIKSGTAAEDEIVAIAGATVTSKAVTEGINAALAAVQELKEAGAK